MALALLLFAVVVAVHRGAFEQPDLKQAVLFCALPLLLLPSALGGTLRRASNAPLPRPLLALALLCGWFAIPAAWSGGDGFDAVALKAVGALFAGLIVTVVAWATSFDRPTTLPAACLWTGLLAAALALLQCAGVDWVFGGMPEAARQALSFFGNTNRTGEFLAPLLVLAVASTRLPADRARGLRRLALFSIAPLTAALVLTRSRGALLAAVVGIAVAFALERRDAAAGGAPPRPLAKNLLLTTGVLLALAIGGLDTLGFKSIESAPAAVTSIEYPTNQQRLALAAATVEMVKDAPWLGRGPGRFARDFPPYRDPAEARIPTLLGARSVAEDPHDQYLLLLAEGGIPALLLFLAFVLPALLAAGRAVVIRADDPRRVIAHANGAALASLLVLALFRSVLIHPPSALVLFLLCGQLLPLRDDDAGVVRRPGLADRTVPLLLIALLVLGGRTLFAQLALAGPAQTAIARVADEGRTASLDDAERWLARAEASDPADMNVKQVRSVVLASMARERPSDATSHEHEQLQRRILAFRPWHVPALAALAAIHLERDQIHLARTLLTRALRVEAGRGTHPRYDVLAAAALLTSLRHDTAAGQLIAAEARNGAVAKDLPHKLVADPTTDPDLVMALLETLPPGAPRDGDDAYAAGNRAKSQGRGAVADRLHQRAHLSFALEHLAGRRWDEAMKSARLARRKLPSLEGEIVEALADFAQGRKLPLEDLLRAAPRPIDPEFKDALEGLAGMSELTAGIQSVVDHE